MKEVITVENFTEAMRTAVAKRGADYVYIKEPDETACRYTRKNGEPGCIIGAALAELGYTGDNTVSISYSRNGPAQEILRNLNAPVSVGLAAQRAQGAQDIGKCWGDALSRYEAILASVVRGEE